MKFPKARNRHKKAGGNRLAPYSSLSMASRLRARFSGGVAGRHLDNLPDFRSVISIAAALMTSPVNKPSVMQNLDKKPPPVF